MAKTAKNGTVKRKHGGPLPGTVHPDRSALRRWFGDLEVIEAKHELRLQPNKDDARDAIPQDAANCVFSRCAQRVWGSKVVVFFGTVAYVDLLGKDGVRRVERFRISSEGRRAIKSYDKTGKWPEKGFVILPPTPSTTAAASRKRAKEERRKALLVGHSTGSNVKRPKRKPTGIRLSRFRNGMGMVHFTSQRGFKRVAA